MTLYRQDLAFVHATAFTHIITQAMPGIIAHLQQTIPPGSLILDIGCGAGNSTRALTDAGYQTLGIDPSPDLFALARQAAPAARFQAGSAYDVTLDPCHAILAINEPLTYHAPDVDADALLQSFFRNAAAALPPTGQLIFDLILADGPALDSSGFKSTDTWALLWQNTHDRPGQRLTRSIEIFRQSGSDYRRSKETHHVRLFTAPKVLQWLSQAGFTTSDRTTYGGTTLPARRAFFAQKI